MTTSYAVGLFLRISSTVQQMLWHNLVYTQQPVYHNTIPLGTCEKALNLLIQGVRIIETNKLLNVEKSQT